MKPVPFSEIPSRFHAQIAYQLGHAQFYPYTDSGARPLPELQKLKAPPVEPAAGDHKAGVSKVDAGGYPSYRVSVTLRISDERDRDNDGAVSTLFDCLVSAVGRLAQMDSLTLRKHAASFKRKRGRGPRN